MEPPPLRPGPAGAPLRSAGASDPGR